MSIYSYSQSKVIDEITFRKTGNGAFRAYLHACADMDLNTIKQATSTFIQHNLECIPFNMNGKPTLEVRGFSSEGELLAFLRHGNFIDGKPTVVKESSDKVTWLDIFRKRSLQLSGAVMAAADIGYIKYGAKEKKWEDTLAGLAYFAGSTTLLAYGRNDQSQYQVHQLAEMILEHARNTGMDIPAESAAAMIGKERKDSLLQKVGHFFERNPSEIANMMYVGAGAMIAKSGLQHRALATPRPGMSAEQIRKMRLGGWSDTALGVTTMGSGLIATFVKEKAHDADEPKKSGFAGIGEWVKESPLRVAGIGYLLSTGWHAVTTFVERLEAKRAVKDMALPALERAKATEKLAAVPWRASFVGLSLIGEALLAISSKGHGEGVVSDRSVDSSAIAIAAELIVYQPLDQQEKLINQVGKFLGQQDTLALEDEEMVQAVRKQVEELRSNPWVIANTKETAAPAVESVVTPAKTEESLWQSKMAAREASAPEAQLAI